MPSIGHQHAGLDPLGDPQHIAKQQLFTDQRQAGHPQRNHMHLLHRLGQPQGAQEASGDAEVMDAVLDRAPRAIAYVACDPAALGRDLGHAVRAGWQVASVRGFDLFPMTHHLEAVALLLTPSR